MSLSTTVRINFSHFLFHLRCYLGWQAPHRDPKTNAPVADPAKFPSGIKALAGKIHNMGLKVEQTGVHLASL